MSKTTIADTRIKLRPSKQLLELLDEHKSKITELPENIAKALKSQGFTLAARVEILTKSKNVDRPKVDLKLLKELTESVNDKITLPIAPLDDTEIDTNEKRADAESESSSNQEKSIYFYLPDIYWINDFLTELRSENKCTVFLHDLLQTCELLLPENEIRPRNPELEARCQRLRAEQENHEYNRMTKNVDATRQKFPEDTVSYQIKAINKQLVAVFQFVVSVVTGFVFGFWGLQLIFGNLQFGFRLILGIIFALIIALAEMYFLAVKLNQYDTAVDSLNPRNKEKVQKYRKPHMD